MTEATTKVYARKNRAKKWGTTYHLFRNSCPMIKNKTDIGEVEYSEYVKDLKERKKDFSLCKACQRMQEEKAEEKEAKAKGKEKAEKKAAAEKEKDAVPDKETAKV